METWYRTKIYWLEIVPVEVEKHTDKTVTIDGRRNSIATTYENYFPTWEEAKKHLVGIRESKIFRAEETIREAKEEIEKINLLSPPLPTQSLKESNQA